MKTQSSAAPKGVDCDLLTALTPKFFEEEVMTVEARSVHVNITFKNTDATEPIKNYASEKISNCLKKFIHQDVEAHVVLRIEKNRHIAEITLHNDGADFVGSEESGDLYASIDSLVDSLTRQLRKHKEKLTKHH